MAILSSLHHEIFNVLERKDVALSARQLMPYINWLRHRVQFRERAVWRALDQLSALERITVDTIHDDPYDTTFMVSRRNGHAE